MSDSNPTRTASRDDLIGALWVKGAEAGVIILTMITLDASVGKLRSFVDLSTSFQEALVGVFAVFFLYAYLPGSLLVSAIVSLKYPRNPIAFATGTSLFALFYTLAFVSPAFEKIDILGYALVAAYSLTLFIVSRSLMRRRGRRIEH